MNAAEDGSMVQPGPAAPEERNERRGAWRKGSVARAPAN
jgi:hypothetical protein